MNIIIRQLPACFLTLVLLAIPLQDTLGNRQFGLFYEASGTGHLTYEEVAHLEKAGIQWLLVEEELSEQQRIMLPPDFSLLVMIPEYFPIPIRLTDEKYRYRERVESLMRHYRDDVLVAGFGLFAYGTWQRGLLPDRLEQLARPNLADRFLFTLDARPLSGQELHPFNRVLIMTRSASQLERQLEHNPALAGVLYAPKDPELDLRDFQAAMQLLESHREVPFFFHRNWFFANSNQTDLENKHDLSLITRLFHEVPDARLANPPPPDKDYQANISIFLLFFFWVLFAAWFRINPIYRRSVTRFFLNYDFFVNDVLMRRIRFSSDAGAVFLLSCLLAGIMGFSIAELYLDPVARQALLHYTPVMGAGWDHPFIFFILFFFVMALLLAVKIVWLYIANSQHAHVSQIATFLLWPQHLNILVVSSGIIFLHSFPAAFIVVIMTGMFLTVTVLSFFTSAYNMRQIHPTSSLYMATTYALFVLVATSIVSWLIFGLDILKAWDLAVSLTSL
jgi:hypothetical protein